MKTKTRMRQMGVVWWLMVVMMAAALWLFGTAQGPESSEQLLKKDIRILQSWSGDYPVDQLGRLPAGQQTERVGYISDRATFAAVWQHLKPGEARPDINFEESVVVFSRNVEFYNRITISRAMLENHTLEILTIETRSALPTEGSVAMALAVIPRAGVAFIQSGSKKIPLPGKESASDPLNAAYEIGDQKIALVNGRCEAEAVPGSALRIRTTVFGTPVPGDLDNDGDDDAALVLVHDPGGSGTFYYVAAAIKENGTYSGTNGVFLGDRIEIKHLRLSKGVIVVNYADRNPGEPMSVSPSVETTRRLILKDGALVVLP